MLKAKSYISIFTPLRNSEKLPSSVESISFKAVLSITNWLSWSSFDGPEDVPGHNVLQNIKFTTAARNKVFLGIQPMTLTNDHLHHNQWLGKERNESLNSSRDTNRSKSLWSALRGAAVTLGSPLYFLGSSPNKSRTTAIARSDFANTSWSCLTMSPLLIFIL